MEYFRVFSLAVYLLCLTALRMRLLAWIWYHVGELLHQQNLVQRRDKDAQIFQYTHRLIISCRWT